jgi:hypothetical protein
MQFDGTISSAFLRKCGNWLNMVQAELVQCIVNIVKPCSHWRKYIFFLSTHLLIWFWCILWGRPAQIVGSRSLWQKFSWWSLEFILCVYIISAWPIIDYGKIISFFLSHSYVPATLFLVCCFLSLFICPFYCHSSPLFFLLLLQVKIVLLSLFF